MAVMTVWRVVHASCSLELFPDPLRDFLDRPASAG